MIAKGRLKKVENSTLGPEPHSPLKIPKNKQIFASSDARFCSNMHNNGCDTNNFGQNTHNSSLDIRVATNSEFWPNTEYIRFWKFNENWIINFLKIDWIRIVLFGLNYSNTECWRLIDAHCHKLNLWLKEKRRIWFFIFVAIWSFFLHFLYKFCIMKIL